MSILTCFPGTRLVLLTVINKPKVTRDNCFVTIVSFNSRKFLATYSFYGEWSERIQIFCIFLK